MCPLDFSVENLSLEASNARLVNPVKEIGRVPGSPIIHICVCIGVKYTFVELYSFYVGIVIILAVIYLCI